MLDLIIYITILDLFVKWIYLLVISRRDNIEIKDLLKYIMQGIWLWVLWIALILIKLL